MKALHRKLLRDLRLMWSQALTIALVVASGTGGFLTSLSAVDSLAMARDHYYADGRFADVFVTVRRAPARLVDTLLATPGVADVQATLEKMVRVQLPGVSDPVVGQMIGLDRRQPPRLNRVTLVAGRMVQTTRTDGIVEVLVSEGFAQARALAPGSRLQALINGRQRTLEVAGIALSPEFVFAGLWGMPDLRGFGVFWVDHDTLAAAYDMQSAFNQVAVRLAPGASEPAVIDTLTRLLAPYGGRQAIGRADQTSNAMLDNEITEQRVLGTVLPVIFLGVAAFLLNMVIQRQVATQREQIAALKALGYGDGAITRHYLLLVTIIVLAGLLLGVLLGDRLGTALTRLYAEFFRFPTFEHRIAPPLLVTAAAIAFATALAGTAQAIMAATRLPPAEAMRPPAPARFGRGLLEVMHLRRVPPALRMLVRNIERRPLRSAAAVTGIAAAVAIVVLGNFVRDAIDVVVDAQLTLGLRGDITVWTADPVDDAAARELARLPGVKAVESTRFVAVTFRNGHRVERGMIRGYAARPELYRIIDAHGHEMLLDGKGLVLTDRLADKLGLAAGDIVQVEVLEGDARTLSLPVGGTVSEMMGLNAYMDRRVLDTLLGEGDLSSGFVLSVEPGRVGQVLQATQAMPRTAGAWSKQTMLRNMEEVSARNVRVMSTILTLFASVIAIGVVYNNARIALAERRWELASLRVLGFTRAEVSVLLLGELAIFIAIALPLGMLLGWMLTSAVSELLKSDQFHFPVVIRARTYAWAALCVLAAGVASAWVVRRQVDRLDMVSALKTRE